MYFLGVKAAGAYGWQPYHHPVPLSWNLGTLTSWATPGLWRDCFTFTFIFTLTYLWFMYQMLLVLKRMTLSYNPKMTLTKLVVAWSMYRRYWRKSRNSSSYDSRSPSRDTNREHPRCTSQLLGMRGFNLFTQTASNRIFLANPFMNSLRFTIVMQKSHELLFWMGWNWNDGWAVGIR